MGCEIIIPVQQVFWGVKQTFVELGETWIHIVAFLSTNCQTSCCPYVDAIDGVYMRVSLFSS
jgi:hypothetical protein